MFETALERDEMVLAVSFPVPSSAGYAKLRQPASRYALVGAMIARTPAGVRVAVIGAGANVFRQTDMEVALIGISRRAPSITFKPATRDSFPTSTLPPRTGPTWSVSSLREH